MVKGVSRQVVVVPCPDARFFDEAIFMVRNEVSGGPDYEVLLKDACRAADAYIQSNLEKRKCHSERWVLIGGALLAVGAAIAVILL